MISTNTLSVKRHISYIECFLDIILYGNNEHENYAIVTLFHYIIEHYFL